MMRAFVTLIVMVLCTAWAFIVGMVAGDMNSKAENEIDKRDSALVAFSLCAVPTMIAAMLLNI